VNLSQHALHGFFESLQLDLTYHKSSTSVSVAVIGRIETEGAAAQLEGHFKNVATHPADKAAEEIVRGALLRELLVYHPKGQLYLQAVTAFFAREVMGALVILNGQNHPCTDVTTDAYQLVTCWGPMWEIVNRRRYNGLLT
jgi:hypothetical protein